MVNSKKTRQSGGSSFLGGGLASGGFDRMNRMNRILGAASLRGSPANGSGAARSYAHWYIL